MKRFGLEFYKRVIEEAKRIGIKPSARQFKIAPNTIRRWLKFSNAGEMSNFHYHRPHNRIDYEIESFIANLKERDPTITLKTIQTILVNEKNTKMSLEGIKGCLYRFGMSWSNYLPLRVRMTSEIEEGLSNAEKFISQGNLEDAAMVLNSLPALSDFSILEKIPSSLLTTRRQVEQLEPLVDKLSKKELLKKARAIHRRCEKEKLFYSAIFAATIEANALNFLGYTYRVSATFKKYKKFLNNLPPPMKYLFLSECYISYVREPGRFPQGSFKNFLHNFENFCKNLPPGGHKILWYYYLSGNYYISSNLRKASFWMEKLLGEKPEGYEKKYLSQYFGLLALNGEYEKLLKLDSILSLKNQAIPSLLRIILAKANALLGTGSPNDALSLILNQFSEARREHLITFMHRFSFFLAYCYGALNEHQKMREYLKQACAFSKGSEKSKILYKILLQLEQAKYSCNLDDAEIRLTHLYLNACKNLSHKDYLRAYNYARKKGLIGFFHRLVLLHPSIVIKFIKEQKKTYLPEYFLNLPVLKCAVPSWQLFLLREKETIFYGEKRIGIPTNSRDFHLLVYLFLNRKRNIRIEDLLELFYRNTNAPERCLIKALSRIRNKLRLSKRRLISRMTTGVYFDVEARVDLEAFEEHFKIGKVFEKGGKIGQAIKEYQVCFKLYKKSPFEKMGYYYNFAEDRRTIVRNMFQQCCVGLLTWAKERGNYNWVNKIKAKMEKEGLTEAEE